LAGAAARGWPRGISLIGKPYCIAQSTAARQALVARHKFLSVQVKLDIAAVQQAEA
jgi:hypothetical protein